MAQPNITISMGRLLLQRIQNMNHNIGSGYFFCEDLTMHTYIHKCKNLTLDLHNKVTRRHMDKKN